MSIADGAATKDVAPALHWVTRNPLSPKVFDDGPEAKFDSKCYSNVGDDPIDGDNRSWNFDYQDTHSDPLSSPLSSRSIILEQALITLFNEENGADIIDAEPLQALVGTPAKDREVYQLQGVKTELQRAKLIDTIQKKKWIRDAIDHVGRSLGLSFGDYLEDYIALFQCVETRGRPLPESRSPRTHPPRSISNRELHSLSSDNSTAFGANTRAWKTGKQGSAVSL
ncbi:uncharacterized protein LOC131242829 [Magnolia sinica]|uniref:uncharacterized protein LOC131242829 n=1 Tax=Magnolia sinica TaxID=86752 RepID=UPI002659F808|nr:uncharacterized protein LOC131242829 [Magnolia sinica]